MSLKLGYSTTTFVEGQNDAFMFGMHGVYLLALGLVLIGLVLSIVRLKNKAILRFFGGNELHFAQK